MESFWMNNKLFTAMGPVNMRRLSFELGKNIYTAPNGRRIEIIIPPRPKANAYPPRMSVTGFKPRRNSPSPSRGRREKNAGKLTIMLRNGPRNIYNLLENRNLPNVVKEGLKEVLYARLLNGGSLNAKLHALATVKFKKTHKYDLYNSMNTTNLFRLLNSNGNNKNIINSVVKKRALV